MEPGFRAAYNAAYSPLRYERYVRRLRDRVGCEAGFRLAETPVFLPPEFVAHCERAATEIVAQLTASTCAEACGAAVPPLFDAPARGTLPQFAVVDFAVTRSPEGRFEPRLVELQGFPSLFAFEVLQHEAWAAELAEILPGRAWSSWHGGLAAGALLDLLRRAIVGDEDPAEVVLVDVEPQRQKTYCDFEATRLLFGVEAADPRQLYVRGGRTYRRDAAGRERRVVRVYNRLVGDDLARLRDGLQFDLRDDLGVTWAPHPAWFWRWSKASLPYLDHACAPRTRLISDGVAEDEEIGACVLKPLFSFAGSGVNVRPTREDVRAIPAAERAGWCLQEKIEYAPAFMAVDGEPVKVELRVLLARPDTEPALVPALNLCRLSRGEMLGVDFNRERTWVGSSIGVWEAEGSAGER